MEDFVCPTCQQGCNVRDMMRVYTEQANCSICFVHSTYCVAARCGHIMCTECCPQEFMDFERMNTLMMEFVRLNRRSLLENEYPEAGRFLSECLDEISKNLVILAKDCIDNMLHSLRLKIMWCQPSFWLNNTVNLQWRWGDYDKSWVLFYNFENGGLYYGWMKPPPAKGCFNVRWVSGRWISW